jgi:hypothetical protein
MYAEIIYHFTAKTMGNRTTCAVVAKVVLQLANGKIYRLILYERSEYDIGNSPEHVYTCPIATGPRT